MKIKEKALKNSYLEKKTEKMEHFEKNNNLDGSQASTPFFKKKFLKGYSKIHELKLVSIGLASPEKIQSWAEKELPNGRIFGEVTNANTFHYRTFQPTKGGLFCERIFGPLKDFECACGKRQKPTALESKKILEHKQTTRYFCANCDVEYTWSIIRRYQLGYIKLNAPVTHLWYLKTNPSYLSIFFDMKRKDLESVVYCTDSLTIENVWKHKEQKTNFYNSVTDLYMMWQKFRNFEEKKQNFEKHFQRKKQKRTLERQKFLSQFEKEKKNPRNWKIFEKEKFSEFPQLEKIFKNKKEQISFVKFESSQPENLSPLQFKIYKNIQEQKQKVLLSFIFKKIFQKQLKTSYGNTLFKIFSKNFFLNEKTKFHNFQNLFLFDSFFEKNFSKMKNIEKFWILFFFISKFEIFLFSDFLDTQKSSKKQEILSKKKFLFFLQTISFLKKKKNIDNIPTSFVKKQKLNFLFEKNSLSIEEIEKKANKFIQEETQDFVELFLHSKTIFLQIVEIFFNKKKTKFLLFPSENLINESILSNEKKNLKQNSILQVSNQFFEFKQQRIFAKKQKEFLQKSFHANTFDKEIKSKNATHRVFFDNQKLSRFELKKTSLFKIANKALNQFQTNPLKKSETSKFLKNPVFTICYNFLWKNDSDWTYFLYYNSLFSSEFEDIPIYGHIEMPLGKQNSENFQNWGTNTLLNEKKEKNQSFSLFFSSSFEKSQKQPHVGAGILEKLLTEYTTSELKKMIKQHQILLPKINQVIHSAKQFHPRSGPPTKKESVKIQKYIQKREHIVRRLKFLRKFFRKNSNPTFMILRNLPVLPPDLRPILKLQNQIAASDLNRFYQRIIYRNERLHKFSKDSATNQSFEMRYAQRLLQEAVDNLIQNGKGGVKPETNSRGLPLKSLSEILKGKQGRFRQYLLGKRVDYSGRSVIVVGPKLKLYECGVPKEMAFELFLPFLIQQLLQFNLAKTVIGAKNLLKKDSNFAFHLLKKIMKNIPVLLNRAPTLHRLGFQAFLPKLIEGRAILLHPMVCPGFNADFDGDQMAVHVPLTVEARTEAWKFMLSTNNFINSATGDPVLLPTQDMVLGCYYLTTDFHSKSAAVQVLNSLRKKEKMTFYDFQRKNKNFFFFSDFSDVFLAYQKKEISLHSPIWIRWNGFVDFGNDFTKPVEIQIQKNGYLQQIQPKIINFSNQKSEIFSKFIRTTPGRIFMNFQIQEFQKTKRI